MSTFKINGVREDRVFILAINDPHSITDNAASVVRDVVEYLVANDLSDDLRIIFRDTELLHDRGVFRGFSAYEGSLPDNTRTLLVVRETPESFTSMENPPIAHPPLFLAADGGWGPRASARIFETEDEANTAADAIAQDAYAVIETGNGMLFNTDRDVRAYLARLSPNQMKLS